jgi:hypothetical protein
MFVCSLTSKFSSGTGGLASLTLLTAPRSSNGNLRVAGTTAFLRSSK